MLTEEDEETLNDLADTLWTKGPTDVGLITSVASVQIRPKSERRPRARQYPLKPDAGKGIKQVTEGLLKAGIIKECTDSPRNTSILQCSGLANGSSGPDMYPLCQTHTLY